MVLPLRVMMYPTNPVLVVSVMYRRFFTPSLSLPTKRNVQAIDSFFLQIYSFGMGEVLPPDIDEGSDDEVDGEHLHPVEAVAAEGVLRQRVHREVG